MQFCSKCVDKGVNSTPVCGFSNIAIICACWRYRDVAWHSWRLKSTANGPLAKYVKWRVAHPPGMPGTFSPTPRVSDSNMHHGTCVTHVPWCMPGSLTSGFLGSRWRVKRSRHSWRMRNPQFYVSCKRSMTLVASQTTGRWTVRPRVYSGWYQKHSKGRITGPLWGESTGDQWIPVTKGQEDIW